MSAANLRELCEKASPGPWIHLRGDRIVFTRLNDGCRGVPIVAAEYEYLPHAQDNLQLIARCDPQTMLEVYNLIADAVADAESGDGWGPDVTVCGKLRKAIALLDGADKEGT